MTRGRPGQALAVGAMSVLVTGAGCNLIVGSPYGDPVFDTGTSPKTEAGIHRDAGADAHADTHASDVATGHADAAHEAQTLRDTGLSHDAPGANDAHDAATPIDVRTEAARPADAHADVHEGGFCANYVKPQGSVVVCDDFDEDGDAAALGVVEGKPGGTLAVQSAVYDSPTRSILFTDNPPDGSTSAIDLTLSLSVGTTYTVACDVMIADLGPIAGSTHLESLTFQNNGIVSSITVYLHPGADGGGMLYGIVEQDPIDGGYNYASHGAVSVPTAGWMHIALSLTGTPGHSTDSLEVNGTAVDTNVPLAASFVTEQPAAQVGMTYTKLSGERQVYFDNVVYTVE
jgi:hypothetical protein